MRKKIGCGKKVRTLWNFGTYIIVECGFKEDGFMPVLCDDCRKKSDHPNNLKDKEK